MAQENNTAVSTVHSGLGRKSWTAYAGLAVAGLFLICIATPIAWQSSPVAGSVVLLISLALLVYRFLFLRSFFLYSDDMGVWLYRGILPWNKGVVGVKWRDLDEAVYFQSVWSWLFKSYSIRLKHRFTRSNELSLSHWAQGHHVVMAINGQHQDLVKAGSLN